MDLRAAVTPWVCGALAFMAAAACRAPDRGSSAIAANAPPAVRYQAHVFAAGAVPPAGTLENPFSRDRTSAADGEAMFTAMNCDGCHGAGGAGSAGPSLVDGRWRYGGSDGAVFHSIFYGRPRGMPAYGGMLSSDVIWKIVTYLRAQPVPKTVPTESWQ